MINLAALPTVTIDSTEAIILETPREGNMVNVYNTLKNLQEESGELTDFRTDKIKFDVNHPVSIEVQPSYDGSVNLIINDDKNPPLLINTRFSVQENNTYVIPDHAGENDTSLYSKEQVELDTRLYKTVTKIPELEFIGLANNGNLKCGTYHFYFKYSDVDDNETDFITESGLITCHIGNINDPSSIRMGMVNENSMKSVRLKLKNIDTQYDLIKIYYTRTTSDNSQQDLTTAHFIDSKYLIKNDELDITITGFENTYDVSLDEINLIYELAESVKGQAQCQNMLFFGNINKPRVEYQELTDLSLRIIPSEIQEESIGNLDLSYIDQSGTNSYEYYNVKNLYYKLGYWPEEYYRIGVVYILKDYTLSPVFNIRGLALGDGDVIPFDIKDLEDKRIYVDYDDLGYIAGRTNEFDNAKGVIKLSKKSVIKSDGVYPLGLKFTFQDGTLEELKKYTKGFFFVRQKRIPTILAQGCAIGKTKDQFGNIPVLPVNNQAIVEGFVKGSNIDINKEDNPFLIKRWRWRYPVKYADGTPVLMNVVDEIGNDTTDTTFKSTNGVLQTQELSDDTKKKRAALEQFVPTKPFDPFNVLNYTPAGPRNDGDIVNFKNRLPERVGDGLYGYWDFVGNSDSAILQRLKDTFGNNFRQLGSNKFTIPSSNYEVKAAIIPEAELREALFNQIFTSSKFNITSAAEQSTEGIKDLGNKVHYYLERKGESTDNSVRSVLLTMVNDNMKLTTDGKDMFSARAGEAEQAWEVVDVRYDWKLPHTTKDGINTTLTQSTSVVRGSFGTYVGIGDKTLKAGEIFNVRTADYNDSFNYKKVMFETRFSTFDSYQSISDRFEISDKEEFICYRGDCFIGNFTHRMHRNFTDPELPTNDKIVDLFTWYKGFAVKKEDEVDGVAINTILTNFKRNNQGKILEPSDSKYDSAGKTREALTGDTGYVTSGAHKINRADVNAVKLGHWFTFKVMSNVNVSMRDINLMEPAEQTIFGRPRGFFPLYPMSVDGTYKLPESNILNAAGTITLSKRFNFLTPDVPFLKNRFDTRILYSDIHVTDAFKNGFRVFRGGNYRDYPKTYGALVSIKEFGGNLIAVMENGVLLIPVNERAIAGEGVGGNIYINTSNVLPENPKVLSSNFGSIWQDSVKLTVNTVYGVDTIAKKIWRTNGETFEIISDLKVQKFLNDNIILNESDKIPTIGLKNVKTHYNAFKGDVMFTFYNGKKEWNLCYNEKLEKFITFYSWTPVLSENINNIFFTFDLNDIKNSIALKENIESINKLELSNNGYIKSLIFDNYILPNDFNKKIANVITSDMIQLDDSFFKIVNNELYYNDLDLFNSFFAGSDIYKFIAILSPTDCTLKFVKNTTDTNLWKHGQAGVYDLQGEIKPTKWYNKQEPFEIEFIVKDPPIYQKIFDNLKIISNKSKPKEFEFEVVGEGYDWFNYKDQIIFLNDRVTDNYNLEDSYSDYLAENPNIKKLPFIKRIKYTPNNPLKDYKWENNSTDVWLVKDTLLNEERIHTNQLGNDIKTLGRMRGNMQYLEDFWNVEIRPINFKYAYLDRNVLKFTSLKQSKIRDKYLKIKVRYSGEDLTIIQAIKTLFTISYA